MSIGALDDTINTFRSNESNLEPLKQRLMRTQLLLTDFSLMEVGAVALSLASSCMKGETVDEAKANSPVTDRMIEEAAVNSGLEADVLKEKLSGRSPLNIVNIAALTTVHGDCEFAMKVLTGSEQPNFAAMVTYERELKDRNVAIPRSVEAAYQAKKEASLGIAVKNAKADRLIDRALQGRDDYPESRSPSPRASSPEPSPVEEKLSLKAKIAMFEKAAAVQSPAAGSTPRVTKATSKGEGR